MVRNVVRAIFGWSVLFGRTVFSAIIVLFFSAKRRCFFSRRGSLSGGSVFLVGNGPSAKLDLCGLVSASNRERFSVCVVNSFAVSEEFLVLRPELYVLADPNYWIDSSRPDVLELRKVLLDRLNDLVEWNVSLFLPYEAKECDFVGGIRNDLIRVCYYNRVPVDGFKVFCHAVFAMRLGIFPAYNVLIPALHISIEEGFERIFLVGADHSWHEELSVSEDGCALVEQKHFYPERTSPVSVKKPDGEFTVGELFVRWGSVFGIYHRISCYAKARGVDIVNVSSKTYIDAFERAKIADVLDGL